MGTTVSELTGSQYNELKYNSAKTQIKGSFVKDVCKLLKKCNVSVQNSNVYNQAVANAVSSFQKKNGLPATGILNNTTYQAMQLVASGMSSKINPSSSSSSNSSSTTTSVSPHYKSFFDTDRLKTHRKNHKDIKIVFGNKSVVKTIKNVFMRSVTVEVDTSGNPIYEVYEFIARDIKESDELTDLYSYTNGDDDAAAPDVKYKFNF